MVYVWEVKLDRCVGFKKERLHAKNGLVEDYGSPGSSELRGKSSHTELLLFCF